MILRILCSDAGVTVNVEDEGGVLFTVAAADKAEADALVEKAAVFGADSIRPVEPVHVAVVRKAKVEN